MKRILLLTAITALIFSNSATAQVYEFGVTTFINNGYLYNQNVVDRGNEQGLSWHTDLNYGLSGVWYPSYFHGIQLEVGYGKFTQDYSGLDELLGFPHKYEARTTLTAWSLPLSWRIGFNDYFELGVNTQFITKAQWEYHDTDEDYERDVIDSFNTTNFSIFGGMGATMELTGKLRLSASIRGSYGLVDLAGVDAYGNNLKDTENEMLYNADPESDAPYVGYEPTNSLMFTMKLGLIYRLIPNSQQ